jgi:hypothetical protein
MCLYLCDARLGELPAAGLQIIHSGWCIDRPFGTVYAYGSFCAVFCHFPDEISPCAFRCSARGRADIAILTGALEWLTAYDVCLRA